MSQKTEKPVLSGQRIKTRKRDEKEKYDPVGFRDAVLQGFNEAGGDLDKLSKYLDSAGAKLDYRRYADTLFDILFAGGILAPGGTIVEDVEGDRPFRTDFCLFHSKNDHKDLRSFYEVFFKLIRRYKYLEKSFQDELKKLILFLKGFTSEEREKLAVTYGIFLASGLGNAACLSALFEDHLVKDGLALDFATHVFKAWLREKDMGHVASTLKRAGIEGTLMNLLPINKRSAETFEKHFSDAGLGSIVDYQRAKASAEVKRELQKEVEEMMKEEEPVKEMIASVKDYTKKNGIMEHEAVVMVWNTVMNAVEWNKKEELVWEQALKHLRVYAPLMAALASNPRSELALLIKIQEFCYDNMVFMKQFQKIVVLFYKADVLSEDSILKWYKEAHTAKGKSVFLDQMKKFVEWLHSAEEESEEEED
jgi:hypothetical protein